MKHWELYRRKSLRTQHRLSIAGTGCPLPDSTVWIDQVLVCQNRALPTGTMLEEWLYARHVALFAVLHAIHDNRTPWDVDHNWGYPETFEEPIDLRVRQLEEQRRRLSARWLWRRRQFSGFVSAFVNAGGRYKVKAC